MCWRVFQGFKGLLQEQVFWMGTMKNMRKYVAVLGATVFFIEDFSMWSCRMIWKGFAKQMVYFGQVW